MTDASDPTPVIDARGIVRRFGDGPAAVTALSEMLTEYPEIKDVHFWAQFPGESIESGSARIEYMAQHVLPAVRSNLNDG